MKYNITIIFQIPLFSFKENILKKSHQTQDQKLTEVSISFLNTKVCILQC